MPKRALITPLKNVVSYLLKRCCSSSSFFFFFYFWRHHVGVGEGLPPTFSQLHEEFFFSFAEAGWLSESASSCFTTLSFSYDKKANRLMEIVNMTLCGRRFEWTVHSNGLQHCQGNRISDNSPTVYLKWDNCTVKTEQCGEKQPLLHPSKPPDSRHW